MNISLSFDRKNRTWKTGETVSGTISIQAKSDKKCSGISVSLMWTAHGGRSDRSETVEEISIDCAYILAGNTDIPFSFQLPKGPITYHGKSLNIDWKVDVFASLAWSLGESCEQDFIVLPGPTARAHHELSYVPKSQNTKIGLFIFIGLVLAVPGAYMVYITSTGGKITNDDPIVVYIVGGLMIAFGILFILVDLWNLFASATIGKVEVEIKPNTLKGGDTFEITTSLTPRRSCELNGIKAYLSATERIARNQVVSSQGSRTTKKVIVTSVVHAQDQVIKGPIKLREGHPKTFKLSFVLPADAPPSFEAGEYGLAWRVDLRIDIPMHPDWSDNYGLLVEPRELDPVADVRE
ncbi:MAG TPA: hypothetical protein ENK31_08880 [Nannocystis exedens]|nr:hypothetical protein [Nannocystis exedens]